MKGNRLTGIVMAAIGIVYAVIAANFPDATIGSPNAPKIFPMALGILLAFCGILLILTEKGKKETTDAKPAEKVKFKISQDTKQIIFTCVAGIVYALLFNVIGYVLSTILFMGAMLFTLNGKEKWLINIIVAVAFSVGVYFIFLNLFGIPLPMMPILEI